MDPALSLAKELARLEASAADAARLLQAVAGEARLLLLCRLMLQGPADAVSLAAWLGRTVEAVLPELATLRAQGVVELGPEGRYHIEDRRVFGLLSTLKDIFCPPAC